MSRPHRHAVFTFIPLLLAAALLAGCPKKPATPAAGAPGPTAEQPPGMAPGAPGTPGAVTPVTPGTVGTAPGTPGAAPGVGAPTTPGTGPSVAAVPPTGVTPPAGMPAPKEFVAPAALRNIHFDFDRYDIRTMDAQILQENARWLKANPGALVLIEGHADERGTNEYNLALGERRAKATRDYLVSLGVEGGRITIISYGEERPFCAERHEGCWSQNRRAHFLIKQ